jgi:hypothetical protein
VKKKEKKACDVFAVVVRLCDGAKRDSVIAR